MDKKVFVIGLDSTPPELLFDKFLGQMPNIRKLMEQGIFGKLRSCHPPITIPAWMVMATGKSPEELGLYGFRTRKGRSYTEISIANSYSVKEKAIWDILSETGKKSCLVAVPPGYPPKPVNGCLISCFLTPNAKKDFTYPSSLKGEVERLVGGYIPDVPFRTDKRDELLTQIYEMTEKRFKIIRYLIKEKEWDFFMFVEIGSDRIQHAFWKYSDKSHHLYEPGNKYEAVIKDYYKYLDKEIGEILSLLDEDTITFIVSDHGAKSMKGAFCINEWLAKEGYLSLKKRPKEVTRLEEADIDWEKTVAWGWGGYYSRVFLNVEGREPSGVVKQSDYEKVRDELSEKIVDIKTPDGHPMDTKIFKPEDGLQGTASDLMVYFDDLNYRSAGTLGHQDIYLSENDTGPDDAVHSMDGIFIMYDPKRRTGREVKGLNLLDFAPTVLYDIGVAIPAGMRGKVIKG